MLRLAQVLERTGLGKTKIYEMQNLRRFPMSVKVTETSVRWIESEVDTWLEDRSRNRSGRQLRREAFTQKSSD
jgi:prophage regulatory protein